MKTRKRPIHKFTSRALFTIVGGSVLINPVLAQEQPAADEVPEVIVTGLRASLESAQGIKQNSDTFASFASFSSVIGPAMSSFE